MAGGLIYASASKVPAPPLSLKGSTLGLWLGKQMAAMWV